MIEFFEGITKKIDEGSAVDVIYMDFSKAFDKVPHGRLLHKVKSHGVQGEVSKWIQNWLLDRMWRCRHWTGVNTVRVLTTPD